MEEKPKISVIWPVFSFLAAAAVKMAAVIKNLRLKSIRTRRIIEELGNLFSVVWDRSTCVRRRAWNELRF